MNSLQKSCHAFIESVCAELGCRELARPLREGLSVLTEASRRTPLTPERMAEFHELVTNTVKPIVSRVNRFLKPCGLSIVLDYSDKAREHFEYEPQHVAAILHSLQEEGSPVAPVAINEPMIARYYYGTWHEDDGILEHCLSDSLWHEAGHHIVDSAVGIELVGELPDDEDVVESFGRYMTEKTLGYDGDYDIEMVNKAIGAVTLLTMWNSGTYSKADLKKVIAFVGNDFTEQELAERLQECGVQEKTRQAPGDNALQEGIYSLTEGMTPGNLELVRYFRNLKPSSTSKDFSEMDGDVFTRSNPHFDRWVVHNTENALEIYENGFQYGSEPGKLAYTDRYDSGRFAFATPLENATPPDFDKNRRLPYCETFDVGGSIVFKASGVTAFHKDDREDEVIFDKDSPEGCFWIRNVNHRAWASATVDDDGDHELVDRYEVVGNNPDRPLCTGTYDRCIRWCRDNGDAYAHMMKLWK